MYLAWIAPNAAAPEVVVHCKWYHRENNAIDPHNRLPLVTRWRNFDRCKFELLKNLEVESIALWPAHEFVNDAFQIRRGMFNVVLDKGDRSYFKED